MEKFTYTQLPAPKFVRLLKLDLDSTNLSGTLDIHNLDECLMYNALSYTWSEPDCSRDFICSGARLPLQLNLLDALQQFKISRIDSPIWIDAICINQQDTSEKKHQIPLMGQIYSQATKVYVWLGKATRIEREAFSWIAKINNILDGADYNVNALNLSQHWKPQVQLSYSRIGLPPPSSLVWPTIGRLIGRPWFNRLWVLQEVLLATSIDVFCGDEVLPWFEIAKFERHVVTWNLRSTLRGGQLTASEIDSALNVLYTFMWCRERKEHSKAKQISIFGLLNAASKRDVSNHLDMVYGILGLTAKPTRDKVIIDYNLQPEKVYIDFATSNIPSDSKLESFGYVSGPIDRQNQKQDLSFPSWCPIPTWIKKDTRGPNFKFGAIDGLRTGYRAGFQGTFQDRPMCTLRSGSTILVFQGYKVDRVTKTIPSSEIHNGYEPLSPFEASDLLKWESSCFDLAAATLVHARAGTEIVQLAPFPSNMLTIYTRTLIANRTCMLDGGEWRYCAVTKGLENSPGAVFADAVAGYQLWKAFLNEIKNAKDGDVIPTWNPYLVMHASYKRDFIATEHGRIGWGPEGVEEGDVIVVFQNGIVPHILRPRSSTAPMMLVGEAYIDGLMNGEVFSIENQGKVALSEILIA
ncbi:hypothetical protein BP5796_12777 [Coleophoma crateriformis]|uniref:Heterokaryon incompatibility domain-containing protein n=1 Tax=Coleophoma crateriformis TaxID=565419 RepID=A0A3D8Q6M0_9HELO|nr:hypothetical protein BP5796_12777 [Coleophoma crateriformis]